MTSWMAQISAEEVATVVGLGADELSKPCNGSIIPSLADCFREWRVIFGSLLSELDLDDIDRENTTEEEKRIAALRKWRDRNGSEATYKILVDTLLNRGERHQAESLCKTLADQLSDKSETTTTDCDAKESDSGSSGTSATNESVLTQHYPLPSGADREFNSVVVKIAKQLDTNNLETISYLMREKLGPDRENMTGLAMLERLEKEGLFHAQSTANLEELLEECGRYDLINKHLKPYCRKFAEPAKEDSPFDEPPRKKPKLEESTSLDSNSFEFNVSDVDRECKNASVHGVIMDVSPIHSTIQYSARKYFSACITDGKETLKFVCFNPALQPNIEKMRQRKKPCTIENCTIKCSTYDPTAGDFELHHTAKTKVVANPSKKFEISNGRIYTSSRVLEQLSKLEDAIKGQIVTVCGKILSITDPEDVPQSSLGAKLPKQECTLADSSMLVPLKIWEGDIEKVRKGKCYRFLKVKLRQYKGKRFLTTTEDSTIEEIDDIGEVTKEITLSNTQTEIRGRIVASSLVSRYKACPLCNSKVDRTSAECTKCHSSVALSLCKDQLFAKFTVQGESKVLTAFAEVISQIICIAPDDLPSLSESQIKLQLCHSNPALFRVNEKGIVISMER